MHETALAERGSFACRVGTRPGLEWAIPSHRATALPTCRRQRGLPRMAGTRRGSLERRHRPGTLRGPSSPATIALRAAGTFRVKAAAHDKAARAEDIAWRKSVELPILHGADDDDE